MNASSSDREITPDPSTKKGRATTRRRRDGLNFAALALAAIAVVVSVTVAYTTLHNRSTILHVQDGRRLGVISTCGINKALISAGRTALQSGVLLPGDRLVNGRFVAGPLTKALGPQFPSYSRRKASARRAADAYENQVVQAIIATVHGEGSSAPPVARGRDGRLHVSCDASLKASGLK